MRKSRATLVRIVVLVAIGGAALAGCSSDDSSGSALKSSDVTGTWAEKDSEPLVDLELVEDGTVSGSDGCNQMTGTWKISGSEVEFGPFAATMMACEDVDTWLSGAASATVDGDQMSVLDDSGKEIGTLTKS